MKGATKDPEMSSGKQDISIRAPNEGSDVLFKCGIVLNIIISIRAPNEGSDRIPSDNILKYAISIRAPNEGSDSGYTHYIRRQGEISIRAPNEGSDTNTQC